MPFPNLTRRGPRPLKRPEAPTVADHLRGDHEEPLSRAQKHGWGVQAALAQRDLDAADALHAERKRAAAEQRKQEDRAWAERQRRVPNVKPIGGGR